MSQQNPNYRWFVVLIFFFFMLLHQTDKLLIGPLESQIRESFGVTKTEMGSVVTWALVVGTILYPIWGYLYDHYARSKLLALASFLWGATTWMSSVVQTFPLFRLTRASTGIDDSSYPGIFTLVADYFGPNMRGKVYGLLQLTQPIGYLLGMILSLLIAPALGWEWRTVFILTGGFGVLLAFVIFFGVREMPRGRTEPEFENMPEMATFKFSWEEARQIFRKKTMWFIFLQGFAGVFPWNVITYWFFTYLEEERGYDQNSILFTMAPVILILAAGYFVGGTIGDFLFKRTNKGRILVSSVGVLMGAIFLYLALTTPVGNRSAFFAMMCAAAIFMPLSSANVIATVYDVTPPEVRSTAQSVEYFLENFGAAFAPLLAGIIADAANLKTAFLVICITAWGLCFLFYLGALFTIDADTSHLRMQMADRAKTM